MWPFDRKKKEAERLAAEARKQARFRSAGEPARRWTDDSPTSLHAMTQSAPHADRSPGPVPSSYTPDYCGSSSASSYSGSSSSSSYSSSDSCSSSDSGGSGGGGD